MTDSDRSDLQPGSGAEATHDVLAAELQPSERELLAVYVQLRALAGRDDPAPCAAMAAKQALVELWNAGNDLALPLGDRPE